MSKQLIGGWFSWYGNAYCSHCGKAGGVQTRDEPEGRYWKCTLCGAGPILVPVRLSCCGGESNDHEGWCPVYGVAA